MLRQNEKPLPWPDLLAKAVLDKDFLRARAGEKSMQKILDC